MKLKSVQDIANVASWEQLKRFTAQFIRDVTEVLNGKISLTQNVDTQVIDVEFTSAQELQVPHSLGRVPTGYFVIGRNVNVSIFNGAKDSTPETLSVQSAGALRAKLLVF